MDTNTTITIKKETVERLKKHGKFGETWDEMINRLLDQIERGGE